MGRPAGTMPRLDALKLPYRTKPGLPSNKNPRLVGPPDEGPMLQDDVSDEETIQQLRSFG